jgi:hypothetical protein
MWSSRYCTPVILNSRLLVLLNVVFRRLCETRQINQALWLEDSLNPNAVLRQFYYRGLILRCLRQRFIFNLDTQFGLHLISLLAWSSWFSVKERILKKRK